MLYLKLLFSLLLLGVLGWQACCLFYIVDMQAVFDNFSPNDSSTIYLHYLQPVLYLLMLFNLLAVYDLLKSTPVRIVNALSITGSLTLATFFLQFLIVLASYEPVLQCLKA